MVEYSLTLALIIVNTPLYNVYTAISNPAVPSNHHIKSFTYVTISETKLARPVQKELIASVITNRERVSTTME